MTKFGQAEFANFIAEIFVKNKLDEILEKENFSSRNAEDIYRKFPSSWDGA